MSSLENSSVDGGDSIQHGLFDGFEGYRTPQRQDLRQVLKTGLVVLDANVLLDLYRYGKQARNDLLKALRAVGERLWVPHQAAFEFWRNRETLLKDPGGTDQLRKTLASSETQLLDSLRQWTNKRSHDRAAHSELEEIAGGAFDSLRRKISELSDESTASWARDTNTDEVLQGLENILAGKVGRPLAEEQHQAALDEARHRAEHKIPPGYLDAKKSNEENAAGDYLIWEQTLLEASSRKLDVLFISRDTKEDWLRKESGELRGPRLELVQELKQRASVRLYIQSPSGLLELAKETLNVDVHEESVSDADRLSVELGELERKQLLASRWWKDERGWDVAAVTEFMRHLAEGHPITATLVATAAHDEVPVDRDLLSYFEIEDTPKSLKLLERSVAEATETAAAAGLLPAQAPSVLDRMVLRAPGSDARVTGYRINPRCGS
ncbi:hypothetical protein J2T11_003198 [Paenarthrobacter nicotinovorans]|uniref:PIN domain-containing protein n=1 Tax=Paenarthrobacter nicotinovorans TaxID=29320 RepID=UPI00277E5064|nr:PIN domain-containing protein [Paenarthrobacter nicotinovorans]MDP9936830.1 hypothetical protein [Paenarthrobacter nicotinovorans]